MSGVIPHFLRQKSSENSFNPLTLNLTSLIKIAFNFYLKISATHLKTIFFRPNITGAR